MKRLIARLRTLFHRSRRERDMNEEIRSHFALHVDDNLRAGMSQDEAIRNAGSADLLLQPADEPPASRAGHRIGGDRQPASNC